MAQFIQQTGAAPSTPASGNVTLYAKSDKILYYKDDAGNETQLIGPTTNYRNRFINGDFTVSQVNASSAVTVTAAAALQYVIDQWYAYCTGANVTGQRVAGSGQSQYRYQFTGAASVTKIGFAQRMEASATYDMNGQQTIVGVDMSNSLLTTVTWTAWYANTADTFGTLASPTRTQIGTGTITVSSTLARYYIPITIPAAATTGIEIEFSVGAQTSGTWVIGRAQFELSNSITTGTAFEFLPYEIQLRRCQRFLPVYNYQSGWDSTASSTTNTASFGLFPTTLRTNPTGVTYSNLSHFTIYNFANAQSGPPTAISIGGPLTNQLTYQIAVTSTAGSPTLVAGNCLQFYISNASGYLAFTGCQL